MFVAVGENNLRPMQDGIERERAIGKEDAAKLRGGEDGHGGGELRRDARMRGGGPLRVAHVTDAPHADDAVAPRLARDPIERGLAVGGFVKKRIEFAVGVEATARALRDDVIAALGKTFG